MTIEIKLTIENNIQGAELYRCSIQDCKFEFEGKTFSNLTGICLVDPCIIFGSNYYKSRQYVLDEDISYDIMADEYIDDRTGNVIVLSENFYKSGTYIIVDKDGVAKEKTSKTKESRLSIHDYRGFSVTLYLDVIAIHKVESDNESYDLICTNEENTAELIVTVYKV